MEAGDKEETLTDASQPLVFELLIVLIKTHLIAKILISIVLDWLQLDLFFSSCVLELFMVGYCAKVLANTKTLNHDIFSCQ